MQTYLRARFMHCFLGIYELISHFNGFMEWQTNRDVTTLATFLSAAYFFHVWVISDNDYLYVVYAVITLLNHLWVYNHSIWTSGKLYHYISRSAAFISIFDNSFNLWESIQHLEYGCPFAHLLSARTCYISKNFNDKILAAHLILKPCMSISRPHQWMMCPRRSFLLRNSDISARANEFCTRTLEISVRISESSEFTSKLTV